MPKKAKPKKPIFSDMAMIELFQNQAANRIADWVERWGTHADSMRELAQRIRDGEWRE